ncbi:MAG TPA: glycosyltransferase [Gammaproteobacteria bacterium]|nr:glycosyltransferase [Gammaproteobacteria bacterium]
MRILHVYRTYFPDPPGGLQEAIRQIALATQNIGNENRIFTLSINPEPNKITRPEGTVIRSRSWFSPASCDLGLADAFRQFKKQIEWANIIHYHFPWPFADFLHFYVKPDKPCIMTYHSDVIRKGWLGYLYQPLMRRMLNSMNAVVATSPAYTHSSPILKTQIQTKRLHVIPLGIMENSYKQFRLDAENILVQKRFGVSPNEYFLFVGVLRPYKGVNTLIEAAAQTGIPVVITGTGREGKRLQALAEPYHNIHFAGQVTDAEKMALVRDCRALVLPSHLRSEAFGMVLVEAAMCGKPMISCEIGTGTSFVNAHEETGFVISPQDPAILAQSMHTLLNDDRMVEQMGQAARIRYEKLFSGQALGLAYGNLYHDVL